MRIDAIRNGRIDQFTSNRSHNTNRLNSFTTGSKPLAYDSVCFKSNNIAKGGLWGTVAGVFAAGTLALASGGIGPVAYGIYTIVGAGVGSYFGHKTDDLEKEKTN